MRISIRGKVLLAGAWILAASTAWAQQSQRVVRTAPVSTDLAVTYDAERAELSPANCGCFWLQGGGADAAVTFWKGLGIAATLTGGHASTLEPGVDLSEIAYLAGPRYTHTVWNSASGRQRGLQIFGQGLFGGVHAFNGLFPATGASTSSANSFALEAGGGLNLALSHRLGVRLIEVDYVRTALPNDASNVQNDLRLAIGLTYHVRGGN